MIRPQGPNVKRLAILRLSQLMLPQTGKAMQWAFAAIDAAKADPDNTLGDDDEAIAGEILRVAEDQMQPNPHPSAS